MNKVRERILNEVNKFYYQDFSLHNDLAIFSVCNGYYEWNSDTYTEEIADFNELLVVVEKDWLYSRIKTENDDIVTDEDVRKFLQNEYTSDDSSDWYDAALMERKIVMVDFN